MSSVMFDKEAKKRELMKRIATLDSNPEFCKAVADVVLDYIEKTLDRYETAIRAAAFLEAGLIASNGYANVTQYRRALMQKAADLQDQL